MTAEVIILNKSAAAVAADSAVTIPSSGGDKVYNSANKIFTLSKYEPVGILIYNSTEFTTKPWETVIKEFRNNIAEGYGLTLRDYVSSFLEYLKNEVPISDEEERAHVYKLSMLLSLGIRRELVENCLVNGIVFSSGTIKGDVRKILLEAIEAHRKVVKGARKSSSMKKTTPSALKKLYNDEIIDGINDAFYPYKLLSKERDSVVDLFCDFSCSTQLTDAYTGFSIVGFGRNDYYPSAYNFREEGRIGGCTKLIPRPPSVISVENEAAIVPLAQREMTESFIEGIDSRHRDYVEDAVRTFVEGIPDAVDRFLGGVSPNQRGVLRRALRKELTQLSERLHQYRLRNYVGPILDAVQFLDKQELAMMAESIVSLAAMKQKVTLTTESVGGPIDVAVISKNDGFIWISRKHYFDPSLNPFFKENYLRRTTGGQS